MTEPREDRFLGAWAVTEAVYAADGTLLGYVAQERHLTRLADADALEVRQVCRPDAALAGHPMAAFAGEFTFHLQKDGRQRRYLGPDVQGVATGFASSFVLGQGVWPRFGYNFRSWSISLSDTMQLTGGSFFRGGQLDAMIIGLGTAIGHAPDARGFSDGLPLQSAEGSATAYHCDSGREHTTAVTRQLLGPLHWVEYGDTREDSFRLEPRDDAFLLRKNRRTVGMAKAYGPLLSWELYGEQGEATIALDLSAPGGKRWFSLRQHFLNGRLTSLEGLRFNT